MTKKNILLSNINESKLLNGELNQDGIKIKDRFVSFNSHSVYDCVYATLSVDSTNTAIEPQNADSNWKKSVPLNVFVRKDGVVYNVSPLVLPNLGQHYNDRIIDKVFPFNEIKRVVKLGFRASSTSNNIEEENGVSKALNTEYVIDYETLQSYDALDNQSFFNINTLHAFNDGSTDSRVDNKLFVRVPKFYYRTTFYKTPSMTYERRYEIISPEVYSSLSPDEQTGFFVPKGFNGYNKLYISASPESDYNVTSCFGSELNYIRPEQLPINSNPLFSSNMFVMTAEVWFGVICYLMRLYTGYINPVSILDTLEKSNSFKETNTDVFTSYFDYFTEDNQTALAQFFDEDDFSLTLDASKFIFADTCYRFTSIDFTPPPEGGDKNLKNLNVSFDNIRQLTITIPDDFQLTDEFDYCRYYITNFCYKNHVSDVLFPLIANETPVYGKTSFRIYSDYISDFVNITLQKTSYNNSGATIVVSADGDIFEDTDVKLEVRRTIENEPTEEVSSQFIAGRTLKFKLFTKSGDLNDLIITAAFNDDDGYIKSPKGMWFVFEVVDGVQTLLTDYNVIREKLLLYMQLPSTNNAHYLIPYTHQTNDFYNCFRECKNTFINYSEKNYKYNNHFSILGFADLFSDFKSSYIIGDYYLINSEQYRLADEETVNHNIVDDIFDWFNPKPTYNNKFNGVYISNLNMGSFSTNDIDIDTEPDSDYNGKFNLTVNGVSCGTTMGTNQDGYTNTSNSYYIQDAFSFSLKHFVCDEIEYLENDYENHYYYTSEKSFYEFPILLNINESAGGRDLNKGGLMLVCKTRTFDDPPAEKNGRYYYPLQSETNICSMGTLESMKFSLEDTMFIPMETTTFNMYSINIMTNAGNVYVPQLNANQPAPFANATHQKIRFAFDQNILLCLNEN